MLFSLLINPLTGKDLDWADPSKHPSVPALGRAVINKCFTEVCTREIDYRPACDRPLAPSVHQEGTF